MLINKLRMYLFSKEKFLKKFSDSVFLFAVVLIAIIAASSFYQFNNLTKANNWVTHTYEVIQAANNSIYLYKYLEDKQREYIFFNDNDALQDFNLNVKKINVALAQLNYLTRDNLIQQKRLQHYGQIIKERIDLFNQAILLKQKNEYTATEKDKMFSQGRILSREIDRTAQEIIDYEKILLNDRNNQFLEEVDIVNYMAILGQVVSILFLLVAFFVSRSQYRHRVEMEKNEKTLMTQLTSIIEGANDMIAAVDYDYQFIIFNQVYRNEFQRLFGKEVEVGLSIADILADQPEAKNIILDNWQKSLEGDKAIKTIHFEIEGVKNTYELTPSLITTEDGITLGALHIIRNITERIKEQSDLQISFDKLNVATQELKNKNDKITLLLEMSDILLATDSLEELNLIIPTYCSKILNFSSGNFYMMHPSKDLLEISGYWGTPSINTEIFTHNQCWSLRLGRIHRSILKANELLCEHVREIQDKELGYVCMPLRAQNEVFGVLYVEYDITNNKHLSDTEKILMNAFAEVIALALANVRLRDNLRYRSIRDPLREG